jgi:opacity protein-like surface antigen
MKLIKSTGIFLFLFIFLFSAVSFSQVKTKSKKFKAPQFTVEINGAYNLPIMDTKGEVADFFKFTNYGTKIGFGGELNFKLAVSKYGEVRPMLTLGYAQFQNDDKNTAYLDTNNLRYGYPLPGNLQYGSVTGKSELFIRTAYAGLGIEYAFTKLDKARRFTPYGNLTLDMNVIWGLYRQTPSGSVPGQVSPGTEISYTINSSVRFGLSVGIGAQYRLAQPFGLNFGIKFKMANLIGKDSKTTPTKEQDPNEENKMNLLDKAATNLNTMLSKDRNIGYMHFYLGFAFYIGKKK